MADRIRAICTAGRDRRHLGGLGWSGVAGLALALVVVAGTFGGCDEGGEEERLTGTHVYPQERHIPADGEVDVVLRREEPTSYTADVARLRDALLQPEVLLRSWRLPQGLNTSLTAVPDAAIDETGQAYVLNELPYQSVELRRYGPEQGFIGRVHTAGDSVATFRQPAKLELTGAGEVFAGRTQSLGIQSLQFSSDTVATVQQDLESVSNGMDDFCVMGDHLYVPQIRGQDQVSGVVHKVTRSGEYVRSFGTLFPAENEIVANHLSAALIDCHAPSQTVFVAYDYLPLIRAYAPDGTLKWTAKLPDYAHFRSEIRRTEDGRLRFSAKTPLDRQVERAAGFHPLAGGRVLFQIQRFTPGGREPGGSSTSTYSYVISSETGEGYYLGSGIRHLFDLTGSVAVGSTGFPSTEVTILAFPHLRDAPS